MIKRIASTLLLSLGISPLGLCSVLQIPTLENPVNVAPRASITASSVYQNEYAEFGTQKLVDGSTSPDRGNSWQAQGTLEGSGMRGTLPAWLIFDLQSDYTLSTVSFFNTVNYPHLDTGTKEFNIQVSSDGVNYSSPLISGQLEWQNQTYQDYSFGNPVSARYVQINLISAYVSTFNGLYNRVGLNEVQIKAVPEPSSLSLLVLGAVVAMGVRRKR
jgi:hypothetical protein